jgi:8-oxo-dGTP pyrophosphatase MutT (NUDIX family)
MQLRSERPRLFYPGHWGLFDGVLDAGEDFETALRELKEEVAHYISDLSYLTGFTFDFSFCGMGKLVRRYFEVIMLAAQLK